MKHLFLILIFCILGGACSDPYNNDVFKEADKMPAANLLESNSENYSSWVELLYHTGLFNTLNLDKEYTCFVPDNDAMAEFMTKRNISSISEINQEEGVNLVRYHLIADNKYTTSDFSDGMFPDSTASGDYLSLDIREGGFDAMYINNEARIKSFNMKATNAVIHTLDAVLTPVNGTIMDNLSSDFSLMKSFIELTGYDTILSSLFNMGAKSRYTLFAISNSIFQINNITDVHSLATYLGESNDNYKDPNNKVNSYIAYHIANAAYSYSVLNADIDNSKSKNIPMYAKNSLISCSLVDDEFYLNYDKSNNTGISVIEKNINCKNGVIHVIDNLMEIMIPSAATVKWDISDYPEVATLCSKYQLANQSSTYIEEIGLYTPASYKSSNSSYSYYLANKNEVAYKCVNYDCLYLSLKKYGWIEMETPMIVAGKYKISLAHYNYAAKDKSGKWSVIIDGDYVGVQVNTVGLSTSKSTYETVDIGEIEFLESTSHTVRFLAGDDIASYLDCLIFQPIK